MAYQHNFVPNTRETVQECLMKLLFAKAGPSQRLVWHLNNRLDKWSCAAVGESAVWRSEASKDISKESMSRTCLLCNPI